ncbi:MAG: hypothetical protein ABL927_00940, partial [Bdellovibrionales bacterium]
YERSFENIETYEKFQIYASMKEETLKQKAKIYQIPSQGDTDALLLKMNVMRNNLGLFLKQYYRLQLEIKKSQDWLIKISSSLNSDDIVFQ